MPGRHKCGHLCSGRRLGGRRGFVLSCGLGSRRHLRSFCARNSSLRGVNQRPKYSLLNLVRARNSSWRVALQWPKYSYTEQSKCRWIAWSTTGSVGLVNSQRRGRCVSFLESGENSLSVAFFIFPPLNSQRRGRLGSVLESGENSIWPYSVILVGCTRIS